MTNNENEFMNLIDRITFRCEGYDTHERRQKYTIDQDCHDAILSLVHYKNPHRPQPKAVDVEGINLSILEEFVGHGFTDSKEKWKHIYKFLNALRDNPHIRTNERVQELEEECKSLSSHVSSLDKACAELEDKLKVATEALKPFASSGYYWVSSKNRTNKDVLIQEDSENPLCEFLYWKRTNYEANQALKQINGEDNDT